MGAGKTTLGKQLAEKLNYEFIDLDHYIENRYRKTVGSIFEEKGEDGFRKIEHNMLHEAGEFDNVIIATGGGAPCFYNNIEYMNTQGITIYLKTSPLTLHQRLKVARNSRPLLRDKTEEELLTYICDNIERRSCHYEKASLIFNADHLDSYQDIEQATNALITLIRKTGYL